MPLLAEPRRRRKAWQSVLVPDPQNLNWRNSPNNVGLKMMEKMGWTDGKGIGKHEQGVSKNIALKPNYTARGLGSTLTDSDHVLVAHQDDYSNILKMLNKKKRKEPSSSSSSDSSNYDDEQVKNSVINVSRPKKRSIQEISRSSKSRIHYRHMKGKDLSGCSTFDKTGIFGRKHEENPENVDDNEEDESNSGADEKTADASPSVVSKLSMADYFAQAAKRKKQCASLSKEEAAPSRKDEVEVEKTVLETEEVVVEKLTKHEKKHQKRKH